MHFKKAITLTDDKPARTFVERCRAYIDGKKEIPPMGWDGAYED
jgi:adenylate cyclase